MKTERLNLCQTVRNAMNIAKYSTVKTVNAVNAALGELDKSGSKETVKMGDGRVSKSGFKVTETTSISDTYSGKLTTPLRFDAWNSAIGKAEKLAAAGFTITIPTVFCEWMDKFAKSTDKEIEAENIEA